jgi:hypothetical protein
MAGVALRAFDAVAARTDSRILLGVSGMIAFSLANTALSTTLVTHGMLLAISLLLLSPISDPIGDRLSPGVIAHAG